MGYQTYVSHLEWAPAGSQIDRNQDSSEYYYLGKQDTDLISIKAVKLCEKTVNANAPIYKSS